MKRTVLIIGILLEMAGVIFSQGRGVREVLPSSSPLAKTASGEETRRGTRGNGKVAPDLPQCSQARR